MPKVNTYQTRGFYLLTGITSQGLRAYSPAAVKIVKGDFLVDDTNGYATNTETAFSVANLGVASETFDNSVVTTAPRLPGIGSGAADITVKDNIILVIPPLPTYQFIVPVATTLITQTSVGIAVDLDGSTCYKIVVSDTTGAANSLLFFIDEIDVSAAAIVGNTYGYAIGHFISASA